MGKAIRSSIKNTVGKSSNRESLFVDREKRLFLSVHVDDIKIGWKETEHQSDMEDTDERRGFGGTNIIL